MIVYGRNPVREVLRGPREVRRLWATAGAGREPWLRDSGVRVMPASPAELEELSGSAAHQGVCAEVSPFRYAEVETLLTTGRLLVALDQVQDPQNLGAIARTAECAGAAGLVIPERRAADITAAVCKASAGAVEHLPIARVRNLADFLAQAKAAGYWCYGTDRAGSADYRGTDLAGPVTLVLGSEGKGLRPRVAASCDAILSIPVRGEIDSLSVSAAAAVLIYAATGA